MSIKDNKAIIRRYFDEVVNQGRMALFGEFMAENVLGYDATDTGPKVGFENVRQVMILFHSD